MLSDVWNKGFILRADDGKEIFVYYWNKVTQPKAVVQIFHGMAEHAGRYEDFAQFLNKNGFIVYADDHRGHGKTAESTEDLGHVEDNGFNLIVNDEGMITRYIKNTHKGLPVFVLAHSFGSFVGQDYITKFGNEVSGIILMGTAKNNGIKVLMGKLIALFQRRFISKRKRSYLLNKLSFGIFNKRIENPSSFFSWLSRDEVEIQKYDNDPFCGKIFTANFFYYFLKGCLKLYNTKKAGKIPKELPIYICCGKEDPVGGYGRSVKKLLEFYKFHGLYQVEMKLYPGARHELLNEINREEVYNDLLVWFTKRI